MLRTQVMIPEDLKKKLELSAKKRGISMAELLRQFADEKLQEEKKQTTNPLGALKKALMKAKKGKDNSINSENFRQNYLEMRV